MVTPTPLPQAWLHLLVDALPGEGNRQAIRRVQHAAIGVTDSKSWSNALSRMPRPLLPSGGQHGIAGLIPCLTL